MKSQKNGKKVDFGVWQFELLDHPTFRITLLAKLMDRMTIRQLADQFDISYAQWRIVARLGGTQDGMTVSRIAEQAMADRAEVSRAASLLEQAGYLIRKENPNDRRAIVLALTSEGHDLYGRVAKERQKFHASLIQDLSEKELADLNRLIGNITEKLEDMFESS